MSSDRPTAGRGLAERVVDGLTWTGGAFAGLRLLGTAQTIVLARLLAPADFGTYGMVSIATGTLTMLTGFGIGEGVIQSRHDSRATLDSAFCLNLARGLVLYALVFASAPWIEGFFAAPDLAALMRVGGLTLLLNAAANVGPILFAKELDYRRAAVYAQVSPVAAMVVSVVLALRLRNVWALVLAQVAAAAVTLPVSYWIHPFRPRLRLEPEATRRLLRYGRYILGSAPLFYLSNHVDEMVVGKRFGSRSLGAYQLAYNTSALPATYLSELVMSVLFPVFARIQAAPETLRDVYTKTIRHLSNLCLPLSAFLFAFAPEFVRTVYGARWDEAVPLLMAFSVYGALRSIMTVSLQIFKATGQTRTILELAIVNLGAVVLVVALGAPYGAVWIAVLLSAMSIPAAAYGFDLTARALDLPVAAILRACRPASLASAGALAAALVFRFWTADLTSAGVRLCLGGLVFAAVYSCALRVLDRGWTGEVIDALRTRWPGLPSRPIRRNRGEEFRATDLRERRGL